MTSERPNKVHQGRNVKRFREMLGLKQEALAIELGEDWNQKRVSMLESKEVIEAELLSEVAKALKVPEEAIKNFDEEKAIYNIQNNYEGANTGAGSIGIFQYCTFNPLEKLMEALQENKRLNEENKALYERLLQAEKEKNELLKGR